MSEYDHLLTIPDLTLEQARDAWSESGFGLALDGSPFFPGTQCVDCFRFVGRDGHFSVEHFEMSSEIASVEAYCKHCSESE